MKKLIILFIFFSYLTNILGQETPASNWEQDGPLTPNFNGQTFRGWVDAICVNANNPQEMLLATRTSGLFRTEDKGKHWYCVTDSLPQPMIGCRAMISLPTDPNYVVAISGHDDIDGGVIISKDFGRTWTCVDKNLPTFRWIDYHPKLQNVLFACSKNEVYYSMDRGESWKSMGAPSDVDFHANEMFKIFVRDNSVSIITKARWSAEALLHQRSFLMSRKGKVRFSEWSDNLAPTYQKKADDKIMFMDYSNRAGKVHYFQLETQKRQRLTFQTSDGGLTYAPINIPYFPVGHWWKNELIASLNDSNIVYSGQVGVMQKFDKRTGKSIPMNPDDVNGGHHDDYRSSHIISLNGADYMAFGHDGGVGLIENGLLDDPRIVNANGDLSINLIHAFDVHEKTGRIVYAYQDGPMFYREKDGTFSEHFIWEGSAAMIQKQYPDEIVGENAYAGMQDKDERIHPIVDGVFGRGGCALGGYFITYHHYPNRFARGLRSGKIALNRDVNVSEISSLPNTTSDVGAVAVCARNPNFLYAATTFPDDGIYKLHRSVDDGKSWENLTTSTVKIQGEKVDLNTHLHWNYIKSLAVDPDDGNTVYCGIAGNYKPYDRPTDGVYRVIKSVDGGKNFVDFSEGLPYVPLDELLTVESDNDLIFCGTVYGIYYRTAAMNRWEPFSNKLPKVEITGLKYDYCNTILYASTYGRGVWKTKVGFDVPNTYQEVISKNTVWDANKIVCDNILVKSGVTLTIKARAEFYRGKKITKEPGGKVVLLGDGEIGEYCSTEEK